MSAKAVEEGWREKPRQRLSRLFGGQNLVNFFAALAVLPQSTWIFKKPGWIRQFLPNRPRQNSERGKKLNKFCPSNRRDDLWLGFCRYPPSMAKAKTKEEELYLPIASSVFINMYTSYANSIPQAWSEFNEEDIKIQRNKIIFNSLLKKHLLNQLDENFKCSRLLCPLLSFESK